MSQIPRDVQELVRQGIVDARAGGTPIGVTVVVDGDSARKRLHGWIRRQTHAVGGYHISLDVSPLWDFWPQTLASLRDSLDRSERGQTQVRTLLGDLADRSGLVGSSRDAVAGQTSPARQDIDTFVAALSRLDRNVGLESRDVARALVLAASPNAVQRDIGHEFLSGSGIDPGLRQEWGIRTSRRPEPHVLARELSRLLALSGPTVVVADQSAHRGEQVARVATGLMELRELTRRTLNVLICRRTSWDHVEQHAVDTVLDRFRVAHLPETVNSRGNRPTRTSGDTSPHASSGETTTLSDTYAALDAWRAQTSEAITALDRSIGDLHAREVGVGVTSALADAREAYTAAMDAFERADAALRPSAQIGDAYGASPDAGSRRFLTTPPRAEPPMPAVATESHGAERTDATSHDHTGSDPIAVAEQLPRQTSREAANDLLRGLTVSELREVAQRLNVTLPHGKKDFLVRRLVEGTVGYRLTHEAILGEPYKPAPGNRPALARRIAVAYEQLVAAAGGASGETFVGIRQLRAALPEVPRAELDAELIRLYEDQRINLIPQSNQRALTADDRGASLRLGGEYKHLICVGSPAEPG